MALRSQADLDAWQASPERIECLERIDPLAAGDSLIRPMSGLDLWFTPMVARPPPRWKVGVVTWLGIFPIVLVLTVLLGDLLAPWPVVLRVGLLTILIVSLMNWLVAPLLTRAFRRWLNAGR